MENIITVVFAGISSKKTEEIAGQIRHMEGVTRVEALSEVDEASPDFVKVADDTFLITLSSGCKQRNLVRKIKKIGGVQDIFVGMP